MTPGDCLSESSAVEFVDGTLDPAARVAVEQHLGDCVPCLRLIAALVGSPRHDAPLRRSVLVDVDGATLPLQPPVFFRRGDLLARQFRLESMIGVGGMGVVWRAVDLELGRTVAIKLLHPLRSGDDASVSRLRAEAKLLASIEHRAIVPIYACPMIEDNEGRQVCCLVMPLLQGESLADRLRRRGALPLGEALPLLLELLDALGAAHKRGIIHRDIKPQNLMVVDGAEGPRLCVLDFGIATSTSAGSREAGRGGSLVGTPAYMAPEQLLAPATVDARADLWSAAVCVFETLTGVLPFEGRSLAETMGNAIAGRRRLARSCGLPPMLDDALFSRALSADPDERPDTARQMRELLLEAVSVRAAAERRPPSTEIIGYSGERAALELFLQQALTGNGRLVWIVGDAGAGKSALLSELLGRAGEAGALVASGSCAERRQDGEAYLPFLEAIASLSRTDSRTVARAVLREHAPLWCLQLPQLLDPADDVDAIRHQMLGAKPERMERELADFLSALAQRSPVVLSVEDAHWANDSSLALLRFLAARVQHQPILVVATTRARVARQDAHGAVVVEVRGWSRADLDAFIDARLEPNDLPGETRAALHARTDGNPLFVKSYLERWVARGQVRREAGVWTTTDPALSQEMPESVRSLIAGRWSELADDDYTLCEQASVEGAAFSAALLAAASGLSESTVESRLTALARTTRLLIADGEERSLGSTTLRFRFSHAEYGAVLYETIPPSRRRALHARWAAALSRQPTGDGLARVARLARHHEAAGDPAQALAAHVSAVDVATARLAYVEAQAHLRRAIELAAALDETRGRELLFRLRRGWLFINTGRFRDAVGELTVVLDGARAAGFRKLESVALSALCVAQFFGVRPVDFPARAAAALAVAREVGDEVAEGNMLSLIAADELGRGELGRSRELNAEALRLGRKAADSGLIARGLGGLGTLDYFASDYVGAERQLDEARVCAETAGEGFMATMARFFRALALGNLARIDEALRILREVERAAERNADVYWSVRVTNSIGWLLAEIGDADEARRYDMRSLIDARASGAVEPQAMALCNLATLAAEARDHAKASALLGEVEALCARDERLRWRYELRFHAVAAQCALARGDVATAMEAATRALARAQACGARKHVAELHRILAECALARGDGGTARSEVERASNEARPIRSPFCEWRLNATAARVAARVGDRETHERARARLAMATDAIAAQMADASLRDRFRQRVARAMDDSSAEP